MVLEFKTIGGQPAVIDSAEIVAMFGKKALVSAGDERWIEVWMRGKDPVCLAYDSAYFEIWKNASSEQAATKWSLGYLSDVLAEFEPQTPQSGSIDEAVDRLKLLAAWGVVAKREYLNGHQDNSTRTTDNPSSGVA